MKTNFKQKKYVELEEFKNYLKQIIGKNENLTRFDFENYIKRVYNVSFYDSLQNYYDANYINVKVTQIKDFVDVLAFNIVSTNYRVTCIPKELNKKYGDVFVYYSYNGNIITDMFVQNIGLKYCNFWGIFKPDGEEMIKKNIKLYW